MKRIALTVCLLLAVVAVTTGEEPPPETKPAPAVEKALHFRIEAGVRPGHIVAGRIEKSGDQGYDRILLDLDGDGTCETVQDAPQQQDYRTKKMYPKPAVTIEREGAKWVLDLYSLGRVRAAPKDGKLVTYAHWSVTNDDLHAWFINGRVTLYADAKTASEAKTIRLGPPFKFDTGTSMQGPNAMVRVGLKDGNGFTMRLARKGQEQAKIRVQLTAGEKQFVDTHATYG